MSPAAAAEMQRSSLEIIEAGLTLLCDTFGNDDYRVKHADRQIKGFLASGTPIQYRVAAAYVEWCCAYPSSIGKDTATQTCSCPASGGWVVEETEDESGTEFWRPCLRCNREAYDRMLERGRHTGQNPAPVDQY